MNIKTRLDTWKNWEPKKHNAKTGIELRHITWQDLPSERVFVFKLTVRVPSIYAFTVPNMAFYVHLAWVLSAYFSDDRVQSAIAMLGGSVKREEDGDWSYDAIPF